MPRAKDFVYFDLELDSSYIVAGSSESQDAAEIALAGDYPVNRYFDPIAEVVELVPTGNAGLAVGGGNEFEATLGFAWHVNKFLKIEQGVTRKNDGTKQFLVAWEYRFAGDD